LDRVSTFFDRNTEMATTRDSSADGLIRRSIHAVSDRLFSPFSSSALASLPQNARIRERSVRTDNIPESDHSDQQPSNANIANGERGTDIPNYGAAASDGNKGIQLPPKLRVPKKIATPIKVEAKVWFANERTWISYLNLSILMGTLALALFNASDDYVSKNFAIFYISVSIGVLVYGFVIYQRRVTMIRKRDPGDFGTVVGPITISALMFVAILSNFVIRVQEIHRGEIPT
jgi:uncharacterized membrane protein YidH (DUF202 family)